MSPRRDRGDIPGAVLLLLLEREEGLQRAVRLLVLPAAPPQAGQRVMRLRVGRIELGGPAQLRDGFGQAPPLLEDEPELIARGREARVLARGLAQERLRLLQAVQAREKDTEVQRRPGRAEMALALQAQGLLIAPDRVVVAA